MKKIAKAFSGLIIIAALFVLGNSLVITYPDEYMIVRQFGEIVRVVETPGVSVKIPFVQTSAPIPKALQIYDIPKSDVITKDKEHDCRCLRSVEDFRSGALHPPFKWPGSPGPVPYCGIGLFFHEVCDFQHGSDRNHREP